MRGNYKSERVWVDDGGDNVILSFRDGDHEGTIYLTPKKARKLVKKLQAALEVRDGDESFVDLQGDTWALLPNGNYAVEAGIRQGYKGEGMDLAQVKDLWGPLTRF